MHPIQKEYAYNDTMQETEASYSDTYADISWDPIVIRYRIYLYTYTQKRYDAETPT